ncbi:hypothetical protein PUN28_002125 [Cardiocondyla obscurior]|uniref:Uncharacterized protein n=1 Tax=Cardiocondyla obscurior TaxID=286306 RepID=A0AAW2GSV7_9HYME
MAVVWRPRYVVPNSVRGEVHDEKGAEADARQGRSASIFRPRRKIYLVFALEDLASIFRPSGPTTTRNSDRRAAVHAAITCRTVPARGWRSIGPDLWR